MKPSGSLNRAARLLDALAREPTGSATPSDLARSTGLPRPTVYRVADTLTGLGWLEKDARSGELRIGAKLAVLVQDSLAARLQRAAAIDLDLLARRLKQTLYLDVRSGLDLVCLERYGGGSGVEVEYGHRGLRGPFGMTPATMAMLLSLPADAAAAVLCANHDRYAKVAGFDRAGFLKSYARSRRDGLVRFDAVVLDRRMCGLGVAIREPSGAPVAGIGMTYARSHFTAADRTKAELLLATAARRIECRLEG